MKLTPEGYTQTAVAVRDAEILLWAAVLDAGAPPPEGFTGTGPTDWIPQDRKRAQIRARAAGFPTPAVRAAERAYDRAFGVCIKTNMGLIHKVSYKLLRKARARDLDQEDLIQEGALGMQRALETFDVEKKVSFSTYAHYWIYQTINRAIENTGAIRVPIWVQAKAYKEGERPPVTRLMSLDAPLQNQSGEDSNLLDVLASAVLSPEQACKEKQDLEQFAWAFSVLTDREVFILRSRFVDEKTLDEIGLSLDKKLTRERVRQIERIALKKLRKLYMWDMDDFNG